MLTLYWDPSSLFRQQYMRAPSFLGACLMNTVYSRMVAFSLDATHQAQGTVIDQHQTQAQNAGCVDRSQQCLLKVV